MCSDKPDGHQAGQSTTQTTHFPVDLCCSLEEKTSHGDNTELGNPPEVSHEIEQTAAVTLQTPELDNTEAINVDQPNIELDDEESEVTRNSNRDSQTVPGDCVLPSDEHQTEENTATEPKMDEQSGSSDIVAETSVDQIQMHEDTGSADPLVKRKIRKRMGMCRLKKMLKGQPTAGNVFEGSQENEAGRVTKEEPVDISISVEEEGVIESEVSVSSFSTPCTMEDIPVEEERQKPDDEVQILVKCVSSEPVTENAIPSHAEDLNPLEHNESACMEQSATESNIREDSNEVTTESGAEVSAHEEVVIAGSLEVPKEANASASNQFGEELVAGDGIEQCSPCDGDMNASTSDHASEQCVELMETLSAPPVIHETEDKPESSDFTPAPATVTAENKADWENSSVSSVSAAPPGGDPEDVQVSSSFEETTLKAEVSKPAPGGPLSCRV